MSLNKKKIKIWNKNVSILKDFIKNCSFKTIMKRPES